MDMQRRLDDGNVADWLQGVGLLGRSEACTVEPAGDGNINWVRRIRVPGRNISWVVKQARPQLERFPEYQVSTDRMLFEQRWLRVASEVGAPALWPRTLFADEHERILVMEDLGDAPRLDRLATAGGDLTAVARILGAFLGHVHAATWLRSDLPAAFANHEMRRLHGEHIFVLPLQRNDFPLMSGLRARADRLRTDRELMSIAEAAWARYLEPRGSLLHGDVQGGNVLVTVAGPRILDAEIAHVGAPAFDLGILVAHLCADRIARSDSPDLGDAAREAWKAYVLAWSRLTAVPPPEAEDVVGQAGFELLRRTIGAARIGAAAEEASAQRLVDAAVSWIVQPRVAVERYLA